MVQNLALRTSYWITAWLVVISASESFAQAAANREKEEAAVRSAGQDYLAAAERGDIKAMADFWTADGTYTDQMGHTIKTRDLLAKGDNQTAGARAHSKIADVTVRFVADNVALEHGEFESPAVDGDKPSKGCYTALWVREGDRWKLDNVQEALNGSFPHADQVASLQVFAGEWSGEANKIAIHISAKWDANQKFLNRRITMTSGKATLTGTQEIGWDPRVQQLRSWMFNDDGSLSEGLWSREGNVWMALSTRVLSDERVSEATQIYKFPDKNTIVWKSIDGSIDGQPTDDFEVVLKRVTEK